MKQNKSSYDLVKSDGYWRYIARPIYKDVYKVSLPRLALYTESEMDVYGITRYSDTKKEIKTDRLTMVPVAMTIYELAQLAANGYPINIANDDEALKVYKEIEEYLVACVDVRFYREISAGNFYNPEGALETLDAFASDIFEANKRLISRHNSLGASQYFAGPVNRQVKDVNLDEVYRNKIVQKTADEIGLSSLLGDI